MTKCKYYDIPYVKSFLESFKDDLICMRGNCDSDVDIMVSDFPIISELSYISVDNNDIYLTHGHIYNENNWNKSIIYVFYNNQPCADCARAMGEIYNIYQQNYENQLSYFEINYQETGEYIFSIAYQLEQPLTLVLVKINDGMSRGFYKIDNPQQWLADMQFFDEQIMTAINNYLIN